MKYIWNAIRRFQNGYTLNSSTKAFYALYISLPSQLHKDWYFIYSP